MFKDKEIVELLNEISSKIDKVNLLLKKIILKGETK